MRSTCLGYTAARAPLAAELERCEREIAAMDGQHTAPAFLVVLGMEAWQHTAPAFLVVLGMEDWRAEQRLIAKEGAENCQE